MRIADRLDRSPQAFWRHVRLTSGCWLWQGGTSSGGAGITYFNGYGEHAHRVAYSLEHPDADIEGRQVRRRCDSHLCVKPAHLYLTPTHEEIRAAHAPGDWHHITAARLGVARETVTRALNAEGSPHQSQRAMRLDPSQRRTH